jgi:hypothetical protein
MPPQKRSPEEIRLQEILNTPSAEIKPGQLPPRPAALMQDPLSTNPELGKLTRTLMNLAPELRRNVSFVTGGPGKDSFNMMHHVNALLKDKYPEPAYVGNLFNNGILGQYGAKELDGTGEVFISPRTKEAELDDPRYGTAPTLAHEFSHAAGHEHRSGLPKESEKLMLQLLDKRRPK